MQIDGNYHSSYQSYPKSGYRYTGSAGEETEDVPKSENYGNAGGKRFGDSGVIVEISGNTAGEKAEAEPEVKGQPQSTFLQNGFNLWKGFWASLEESGGEESRIEDGENIEENIQEQSEEVLEESRIQRGISAVLSGMKQIWTVQVTEGVTALIEKLKVGIQTALKRFGRESDTFGALTDPGTGSLLGGKTGSGGKGKRRDAEREQETNIKTEAHVNEHLMDSYSKSGKYCKINENLTYQQGRAPYKVSEQMTEPERKDSF